MMHFARARTDRRIIGLFALHLALTAGLAPGQAAQTTPPTQDVASATSSESPAAIALRRSTADALTRLAMLDLRLIKQPDASDYAASSLLLGLAAEQVPDDLEIAHRQVEAGWGAGDQAAVLDATRRIVRLDPKDTVALLRLISARLSAFQTAEERLARYDDFLGKKGESLDPSVRSRLALDAALLCREAADDKGFIERLKQAARLDPTNKDAALLAYNIYCERVNNPTGRMELLANLLYSDPLDPNLHLRLAAELAGQGAFTQARRFQRNGQTILEIAGSQLTADAFLQTLVLDWLVEGPRKPADFMTGLLEEMRRGKAKERLELMRDPSQAAAERLSSTPKPEEIRLQSTDQEILRAAAAWSAGDETMMANSLADLEATSRGLMEILETPNSRPAGMTEEDAFQASRELRQELILWKLLTNFNSASVQADLEKAIGELSQQDPARCAIEAWLAVRAGDAEAALLACDRAGDGGQWTSLARGFALDMKGDKAGAEKAFLAASAINPLSALGAIGLERASLTRGAARTPGDERTQQAVNAAAYGAGIPAWIDQMPRHPRSFQSVTADTGKSRLSPLERGTVTLTMRNTSTIPLGVGSDKPINTRFLFAPKLELGALDRPTTSESEVIDLARRLRLLPGETLQAAVTPELGLVGYAAQNASASPSRLSWRVLQGFETSRSAKVPGVGCYELQPRPQGRDALLESYLPADSLVERIAAANDATLPAVLVAARAMFTKPITDVSPSQNDGRRRIADAIAENFPRWSASGRVLAAGSLPPSATAPELSVLDEAILADKDHRVLLVSIFARAGSTDSPILTVAMESGDERLSRAAAIQLTRLRRGGALYSQTGPDPLMSAQATPGAIP